MKKLIFILLIFFSLQAPGQITVNLDTNERTVLLQGIENDTIYFTGTLNAVTDGSSVLPVPGQNSRKWPRNRSHIRLVNCKNVVLMNPKVIGPNKDGGTGQAAYVSALEAQHAVEVEDSQNITIIGLQASYIYGDGLYVRRTDGLYLKNSHIHHNGRQGIAIVDSKNITIRNNHLEHIRRAHIDIENNNNKEVSENIAVLKNRFGPSRLKWIANGGRGITRNVLIMGNDLYAKNFDVYMGRNRTGPKTTLNVYIIDNISKLRRGNPQGEIMKFHGVNNLYIYGNTVPAQINRKMYLGGCYNCTDVYYEDNFVPNGVNEIKIHE